jgi:dienelactone hydrolase
MELKIHIPTPEGTAPALLHFRRGGARFRGTVLVYHGLAASKEVQRKECQALAEAGLLAVAVDAVGHGERRFPNFESQVSSNQAFHHMLDMVNRSADELPAIVNALEALLGSRAGRFGVTGISMGGYIAYAAPSREPRLEAVVPVLGSPDWRLGAWPDDPLLPRSPCLAPQGFPRRALLALNAGRDRSVPPTASRRFVEELRPLYRDSPDRLDYREYPESEHLMREEDWNDLWARVVRWMERFLG